MTLTLTIVRHGDTFAPGEPPRRIGARTDLPLTANGEAQARALGQFFAQEQPALDRILASPLRRTRRTAELLAKALDDPPPIETCGWLAEIDHGPDEDLPEDAVIARIGNAALARWNQALVAPPGWIVDVPRRIADWRALLAMTGDVLVVTSAGAARFVFAADAGLSEQARALPTTRLRTGAWGRIVVADRRADIVAWNERPAALRDDG